MSAGDWGALMLLWACVGALYAALWQPGAEATHAELRVRGAVVELIPLDREGSMRIAGAAGDSTLEIAPGRIRFTDGPCRNRVCIHSGWLSQAGDGTACLPNRISLTLKGGDAVDAVAF